MSDTATVESFDATPRTCYRCGRRSRRPVLVDLDETLYLRNSTEDFLDTARPALLGFALLKLLDLIRPWRRDRWIGNA